MNNFANRLGQFNTILGTQNKPFWMIIAGTMLWLRKKGGGRCRLVMLAPAIALAVLSCGTAPEVPAKPPVIRIATGIGEEINPLVGALTDSLRDHFPLQIQLVGSRLIDTAGA